MKTPLTVDINFGRVRAYMAETLLGAVTRKAEPEIIDNPNNAEMVIVPGNSIPNDSTPNGKNVRLGDISWVVTYPELFLSGVEGHAKSYTVSIAATALVVASSLRCVAVVTTCPIDVAYTFMAAEATEAEAKGRGWWVKIEARDSVGVGNAITSEEVAVVDLVIVAADIEADLMKFAGKPMHRTSTGLAPKKVARELNKVVTEATPYEPVGKAQTVTTEGKKESAGAYRRLLTGVPYMLPMVVTGGLYIAFPLAFGIEAFEELDTSVMALMQINGGSTLALMIPVLAGYIAFPTVDRPGLTSGSIGGILAVSIGSGFTGGIIADLLAGYIVKSTSMQLKLSQSMEALEPILITPLTFSLVVGLAMIYLTGKPVTGILDRLTHWLQTVGTANAVLLGAILGGMTCIDMDGPVNKAVYVFGVNPSSIQTYDPTTTIMTADVVPPLAMGLAATTACHKFDETQREGGKAALVLGLCSISEGAIPFAAHDPMCVLPYCIVGGALTGTILTAIGAKPMISHGGLFVLPIPGAITLVLSYLVAIIADTLVADLVYALLKPVSYIYLRAHEM